MEQRGKYYGLAAQRSLHGIQREIAGIANPQALVDCRHPVCRIDGGDRGTCLDQEEMPLNRMVA